MAQYRFTESEFNKISALLKKRFTQNPDEQKKTRKKIRALGFNISNHFSGFSDRDFKTLLDNKTIILTDENRSTKEIETKIKKTDSTLSYLENSVKSLHPIIDESAEYLVLGTMPGTVSLAKQEYYSNPGNQFWKIIAGIYNEGNLPRTYSDKTRILKKNKIALWDSLHSCERKGSLDKNIMNPISNDFKHFFLKYPHIRTIIFNGRDSFKHFTKPPNGVNRTYIILSSTSSANTHKTLGEKIVEWKKVLPKNAFS